MRGVRSTRMSVGKALRARRAAGLALAAAALAAILAGEPATAQSLAPKPDAPPAVRARFEAVKRQGCSEFWAWRQSRAADMPPDKARAYLQVLDSKRRGLLKEWVDQQDFGMGMTEMIQSGRDGLADLACGAALPDDASQYILMARLTEGLRQHREWDAADREARETAAFLAGRFPTDREKMAEVTHERAVIAEGARRIDDMIALRKQETSLRQGLPIDPARTLLDPRLGSNTDYFWGKGKAIEESKSMGLIAPWGQDVREMVADTDRRNVPDDWATQRSLTYLAEYLITTAHWDEALSVVRRALAIKAEADDSRALSAEARRLDDQFGSHDNPAATAIVLRNDMIAIQLALRQDEAALQLAREMLKQAGESDTGERYFAETNVAECLERLGRFAEATPHRVYAVGWMRSVDGGSGRLGVSVERARADLARTLWRAGATAEAEALIRTVLATSTPRVMRNLDEERRMIADGQLKPKSVVRFNLEDKLDQARALLVLGGVLADRGRPSEARAPLEQALSLVDREQAMRSGTESEIPQPEWAALHVELAHRLMDVLWRVGGQADLGPALIQAQTQQTQGAGEALLRAAARALATRAGAGAEAAERDLLNHRLKAAERLYLAVASGHGGGDAFEVRVRMTAAQDDAERSLNANETALDKAFPAYWDLVSPSPVTLPELQQGGQALLRPDEALTVVSQTEGGVFVFAVSRERAAWVRAPLSASELAAMVARLRCGLDAATCRGGGVAPKAFDRTAAWNLYKALFGDPAIAGVVADRHRLVFVANGALTTLPPSILVTARPEGRDDDPLDLRETPWLVRDRSVAVFPSLVALRALRRQVSDETAPDPFLGFAPRFGGSAGATRGGPSRAADYFVDGVARVEDLRRLPALSGDVEIEAMRDVLNASGDSVLKGPMASKPALARLDQQGRLRRARVLAFATHGLISGDFGLGEPALVLTPPDTASDSDDGLLRASDIAGLRLNADWVVLSACNTGAGDGQEAEGLSGLARAFLFAGARSLLVSHWRVGDAAARRLTTRALDDASRFPGKGRAEALRRAEIALIDDPSMDATEAPLSSPAVWSPFVLVGD